jgi:DNA-binding protein YbaB
VLADPDEAEDRLDQWAQGVRERLDAVQRMSLEMETLRVSASGARGAVTVEVDGSGGVTRLQLTSEINRFTPTQLAGEILSVLHRAQSLLEERADEIVVGSLGADSSTRTAIRGGLRRRLGAMEPGGDRDRDRGFRDGGRR